MYSGNPYTPYTILLLKCRPIKTLYYFTNIHDVVIIKHMVHLKFYSWPIRTHVLLINIYDIIIIFRKMEDGVTLSEKPAPEGKKKPDTIPRNPPPELDILPASHHHHCLNQVTVEPYWVSGHNNTIPTGSNYFS